MRYLFLIYIILNAYSYWANMELRQAQEMCYQISSIALIIASIFFNQRAIKKDKLNLWFGIFMLWFTFIFVYHQTGWSILFNALLGFLIYLTVIKNLVKEDLHFLIKGIIAVVVFALIFWAGQFLGYDIRNQHFRTVGGVPDCSFFGLKAALGIYLALAIPLILSFSWIGLGLLLPLAFTYTTAAYLAASGAILFFYWFRKRIMFWIMLPIIIMAGFIAIVKMDAPTGMLKTRIPMWGMVVQDIHKTPQVIFGYGLDSFRAAERLGSIRYFKHSFDNTTVRAMKVKEGWAVEKALSPDEADKIKQGKNPLDWWDHPHQEFLWLAYETGLTGLILFFIFVYFLWQRFKRSRKCVYTVAVFSSLLSIAISACGHFPFHLSRIGYIVPILLGFFYLYTEE